jgi:hypothetical protein
MLTEGAFTGFNLNSKVPGSHGGKIPEIPPPHLTMPSMVAVGVGIAVLLLVAVPVMIFLSYLILRLRFAFFDCVLFEQDQIAPAWRRYHEQALRYLWLTLGIAVGFWVVIAVVVGMSLWKYRVLLQSLFHGGPAQWVDFLPLFGIALGLFLFMGLFGLLVDTTLNYFVLPHMALEDDSVSQAIGDVWGDMKADPWQFIVFLVMRVLLPIVAGIIGMIAVLLPALIVAGILFVIGLLLYSVSHGLTIAFGVIAGAGFAALVLCAMIGVGGTIGTFMRNYALLFYGGRYPELAKVLWPIPMPPPVQPIMPGAGYPSGSF